jgi:hypothetical protein
MNRWLLYVALIIAAFLIGAALSISRSPAADVPTFFLDHARIERAKSCNGRGQMCINDHEATVRLAELIDMRVMLAKLMDEGDMKVQANQMRDNTRDYVAIYRQELKNLAKKYR